jgi:hypothetical protein
MAGPYLPGLCVGGLHPDLLGSTFEIAFSTTAALYIWKMRVHQIISAAVVLDFGAK